LLSVNRPRAGGVAPTARIDAMPATTGMLFPRRWCSMQLGSARWTRRAHKPAVRVRVPSPLNRGGHCVDSSEWAPRWPRRLLNRWPHIRRPRRGPQPHTQLIGIVPPRCPVRGTAENAPSVENQQGGGSGDRTFRVENRDIIARARPSWQKCPDDCVATTATGDVFGGSPHLPEVTLHA